MSMKNILFLILMLVTMLTSCGSGNREIKYKSYTVQNHAYTVKIPSDFSLRENLITGTLVFERITSNKSDMAFITIKPVDNGFSSFEEKLNATPKFQYTIYKETTNSMFAECRKGMWSAVELGMLKELGGQIYLISVSALFSRSYAEQVIKHIYETMVEGVPSENTDLKEADSNSKANDFKTYSNPHFSISYPKDWKIVNHPDAMSDIYAGAQDESLGFTAVRFDTDASLSEIVSEAKSGAIQGGMKVTKNKNMSINSTPCNMMVCEFDYQGFPIKTVAYTYKKGNTMYSIKFGTQKAEVDANTDLIEKIMSTFRIK